MVIYKDRRFSGRSELFARDVYNLAARDGTTACRRCGWTAGRGGTRMTTVNPGAAMVDGRGNGYGDGRGTGYNDRREVVRAEESSGAPISSVLRREPDAASRGYVDRVLRDNWSQSDIERDLRKSDEYRRRR